MEINPTLLRKRLKVLRGSGAWRRIATFSGVDYSTLVRFVGDLHSPRVDTLLAISSGLTKETAETRPTKRTRRGARKGAP
jgi:hypothetical protein